MGPSNSSFRGRKLDDSFSDFQNFFTVLGAIIISTFITILALLGLAMPLSATVHGPYIMHGRFTDPKNSLTAKLATFFSACVGIVVSALIIKTYKQPDPIPPHKWWNNEDERWYAAAAHAVYGLKCIWTAAAITTPAALAPSAIVSGFEYFFRRNKKPDEIVTQGNNDEFGLDQSLLESDEAARPSIITGNTPSP